MTDPNLDIAALLPRAEKLFASSEEESEGRRRAIELNNMLFSAALSRTAVVQWTGFAMVIISAAYKGISRELMEAARVDGASEWQVFRGIVWPLLLPTMALISTTMIITALKAFDIVYVMSGGQFDTSVIAFEMYRQLGFNQLGRSAAVAVILLLAIVPVMAFQIRQFRNQEAAR
jgi:alpha-glucoside transport system permease protein